MRPAALSSHVSAASHSRSSLCIVESSDRDWRAQSYAWNWFALHAGQRLQLVNFWLVAVAFLASAFVQARSSHLAALAFGIAITGTVSSLAFLRLDVRTRQLVQVAENALKSIEIAQTAAGLDVVHELAHAAHRARRSRFDSYRVTIQGLQLAVAFVFLLAAIYSLASAA